jgi:hypothetical protein
MKCIPTFGRKVNLGHVNLGKFDHINRMITLSLSGFHCGKIKYNTQRNLFSEDSKENKFIALFNKKPFY